MMGYRVVALDLDGTLTNSQKIVTARTLEALRRAARAGARIVLASGRPEIGMREVARAVDIGGLNGFILSYGGGRVVEAATGKVICARTVAPAFAPEIAEAARDFGMTALTIDAGGLVTERPDDPYVRLEARNDACAVRRVDDLARAVDFEAGKYMVVGEPDRLAPCASALKARFDGRLSVFLSERYFCELVPPGVDKPAGLRALLNHLGLSVADLMAVGDGLNDIPMLRYAHLGVAMANAYPETKAVAGAIVPSNDEDGVAEAIEKYVLE